MNQISIKNKRLYFDNKYIGFISQVFPNSISINTEDLDLFKNLIHYIDHDQELNINSELSYKIVAEWKNTGKSFLIINGWVPDMKEAEGLDFLKYIRGKSDKLIIPKNWIHITADELISRIQRDPNGVIANLLTHGNMIFESGRARTPLILFRQNRFLTLRLTQSAQENVKLGKPTQVKFGDRFKYILPVSRYAQSMLTGLYYNSDQESLTPKSEYFELCGTFYYFEPDSTVFLTFETIEIYNNKIHAAYILFYRLLNIKPTNVYDFLNIVYKTLKREPTSLKEKLLYDLALAFRLFINESDKLGDYPATWQNGLREILDTFAEGVGDEIDDDELLEQLIHLSLDLPNDLAFDLNYQYNSSFVGYFLYVKEDYFDQAICNVASFLEIDVIVLTHMIGSSNRVVIEILDTRVRNISLSSLAWLIS